MGIRVLIADHHHMVRRLLCRIILPNSDISIVAEADSGLQTLKLIKQHEPDVVVMEIYLPDLEGPDLASMVIQEVPGVKILAISIHNEQEFVLNMLQAGAHGYLLKDFAGVELAPAIRKVAQGKTYLSPAIERWMRGYRSR